MLEVTSAGTCQSPRRVEAEDAEGHASVRVEDEDVGRVDAEVALTLVPAGRGADWLGATIAFALARATAIANCRCIMADDRTVDLYP